MVSIIKQFAERDARLTKERQRLEDDLKQYTCSDSTPVDFNGVDANEFSRVKRLLINSDRDWQTIRKKETEWSESFLQAQKDEPHQLETQLDTATLTADVVYLKKKPLLHLLQTNPKPEWCRVVADLYQVYWQPDDLLDFPIELCRAFILKSPDEHKRYANLWLSKKEAFYCHLIRVFYDRLTEEEKRQATVTLNAHIARI